MHIGANNGNRNFHGSIDEIRIWNEARSQAEIQAYMKSTLTGTESNLVAYYQFDQSSGTSLEDATGNYDGTTSGDPQWVTSDALLVEMAPPGNAMTLDGTDDYVQMPYALDPNSTAFSVETWFKLDNIIFSTQVLIDNIDSSMPWLDVNSKKLRTCLGGSCESGNSVLSSGVWYHAALTYDGTTLSMYLNGQLEYSEATSISHSEEDFILGVYRNYSALIMDGSLDELRFWNVTVVKRKSKPT